MRPYKQLSRDAGVVAYETGEDQIKIRFRDGSVYLYNYRITGKENVDEMKRLAEEGRGLTTFINRFVKTTYAAKLK